MRKPLKPVKLLTNFFCHIVVANTLFLKTIIFIGRHFKSFRKLLLRSTWLILEATPEQIINYRLDGALMGKERKPGASESDWELLADKHLIICYFSRLKTFRNLLPVDFFLHSGAYLRPQYANF